MRHPNRVELSDVPRRRRGRNEILWFFASIAAFALIFWLCDQGHFWLAGGGVALVIGGVFISGHLYVRALRRQAVADDARFDVFAARFSGGFEVRRRRREPSAAQLVGNWPTK